MLQPPLQGNWGRRSTHWAAMASTDGWPIGLTRPNVELHWPELRLDLRAETFRGRFPIVTFRQLERTLGFSPLLDEVWFEVPLLNDLPRQAAEVYTRMQKQPAARRYPARRQPRRGWRLASSGPRPTSRWQAASGKCY